MKKFNYKQAGKEIGWNFSKMNYSVEHKSNFDYYREVVSNITSNTIMLDIGCGSAEKAIRFYSFAKRVYLTDVEYEMLKKAKTNVDKYYADMPLLKKKFIIKTLDCNSTFNFPDNYFDIAVSRHCGANMQEVHRVLKKGGVYISEDISNDDCQELKDIFNRGQNYGEDPAYKKEMIDCADAGFSEIKLIRFDEIEYYKTTNDLKYLLNYTPILNGFDDEKDNELLDDYVNKFRTQKGIKLNRRLYAFVLKK